MARLYHLFLWPLFIIMVFPAVSNSQSQPGTPLFFLSDQPEETYVHEHYHSVVTARTEYEFRYKAHMQDLAAGQIEIQSVTAGDSLALVDLYNSSSGDQWIRNDNWLSGPVDSWYGITVRNGRVQVISLFANNLTGMFPASLADLDDLRELWVHFNNLSGDIPAGWDAMTLLEVLYINDNQLTGPVPAEWGNFAHMREFYSNNNLFTGTIPPELANMYDTELFNLSGNQLTGHIPPELGNLTKVRRMCLNDNLLTGTIPPELGNLTQIRNLLLYNNQLTGAIPPEIGNLQFITQFTANNNQLSGSIPPQIGSMMALQALNLTGNMLSGPIPAELGGMPQLRTLNLNNNNLSGTIPASLGNLKTLQFITLAGNNLTGEIPDEIGNLTNLRILDLAGNALTGTVPGTIGSASGLRQIILSGNELSGPFPNLNNPELTHLFLQDNRFESMPRFGELAKLKELSIQGNRLRFDDILPNLTAADSVRYAPQNPFGTARTDTLVAGAAFIFNSGSNAQGNQYSWYFNNMLLAADTTSVLEIPATDYDDAGLYYVTITNQALPDLVLTSEETGLVIIESVDLRIPVPLTPENGDHVTQPFSVSWVPHENDRNYQIRMAADSGFDDILLDTSITTAGQSLMVSGLQDDNTTVWWTIRAGAFGVYSGWAEPVMFHLNQTVSYTGPGDIPVSVELIQNYPNPFNPSTVIEIRLPDSGNVRLEVFSLTGQSVAVLADRQMPPGTHRFVIDGSGLAGGLYFYRLQSGGISQTRKMLLIK
jgi:Leucine-rich repeat (LRR) protein